MTEISIAQLYPAELGITGDRGNVRTLEERLRARGIASTTTHVGVGEQLPASTDIVVIGNGPLSALRGVHADFLARADELRSFIGDDRTLFAVGGSAELLGERIDLTDGESVAGLGVMPYRVARTRDRRVGYITVRTPDANVVGFEDHASEWTLADEAVAYGTVVAGRGSFSRGDGRGELVRHRNAFAGNVQGPVLPLNPALADVLVATVAARRGLDLPGATANAFDEYAKGARDAIERFIHDKGFKTIQL
ncbi:glutamine amidotransferase [Microbacterium esteraromaticum]|uniref:Lipid II isoglutaminyl synthase (glutamine-hydrolyzing) subunit GatD n=1 Tax=Microbacterium esteraromaticum TaxID=57043 RepID=A0A7D8AL72_9MICO|nr:glutamine amidotransferase [Microbacterium esteraromaticum]QMU98249.1 glutamine amidotransferase [Microbacterium esteraromaticum]